MRKIIKKIMAVGAVGLLGMTTIGAVNVMDLSDYPDMFVKDGQFDGYIVVGKYAAAEDIVGAIDIATGLQYAYIDGDIQDTIIGDVWSIETPSDKLEMTEKISQVKSYIGEEELKSLADGKFKNNRGSYEYEQEIVFKDEAVLKYTKDDDDNVADYIFINDNKNYATYSLSFNKPAESSYSGNILKDFENKKIEILGKEYSITEAKYYGGNHIKLTLMAGAVEDILEQSESKSYEINTKDYDVEVIWIGEASGVSKVKFKVNGETTSSLAEGETYTISDGTQIGVREILEEEAGEVVADQVEFYLGVQKIVLEDTDIQDIVSDKKLVAGGETIDNTEVIIRGEDSGSDILIDSITLSYISDDDIFIGGGDKLSDKLEEPQGLLGWDLRYEGLSSVYTEDIIISGSGDDELKLKVELAEGVVSIPLAFSEDASKVRLGDDDDKLILSKNDIEKDQYFFLTDKTGHGGRTYFMQYKGADVPGSGNPVIKLKDITTGDIMERTIRDGESVLTLGGYEYEITNSTSMANDDFNIKITGGVDVIITSEEAKITITDDESDDTNEIQLSITYADADVMDEKTITPITFNITKGDVDEIGLTKPAVLGNGYEDDDVTTYVNELGAEIKYEEKTGPDTLTIKWPSEQRYGQAFVTIGAAKTEIKEDVIIDKIDIPPALLDSEVLYPEMENLILIGGPCANSVTSKLMDIPQTEPECYEQFTEGKGIIKLIDNGDNVALIVAGFTGMDTRRATRVLKYIDDYQLSGDEVVVIGTSLDDISVTTISVE